MKALLFHQQLEIRLEISGEEFRQGDTLTCTLSIKNRGTAPLSPGAPLLALAQGEAKKVKQKSADAFQNSEVADTADAGSLPAGESITISHAFVLDKNCLLSDKSKSLYARYGLQNDAEGQGQLQLNVLPHIELEGIIGIFETSFQFLLKSVKSKKDWVAAVLKAPQGPGYRALSELELRLRFAGEQVQMEYHFKVERLEASASTLEVQKKKVEEKQSLNRDQYMSSAGYVDPVRLEPRIRDALSQVTSKFE